MASKRITDLQLRSNVVDSVNFPSDDGLQSYRVTAAQIFDFIRTKYATTRTISAALQTVLASDVNILLDATAGAFTQALPALGTLPVGTTWRFKNISTNSNVVTLDPNLTETIDGALTVALEKDDVLTIQSTATKWIVLPSSLTVRRSRIEATERLPVGSVIPFAGVRAPAGFLFMDGSALSRTTYAALFAELTVQASVTTTTGSASITGFTSTSEIEIGYPISGAGIPAGATVLTIPNATSITISANATATASNVPIVIAPHGVGDGTTTFNLPLPAAGYLRFKGTQTMDAKSFVSGRLGAKYKDLTAKNGLYDAGHTHTAPYNLNGTSGYPNSGYGSGDGQQRYGTIIANDAGYANLVGDVETRPATIVFNAVIKY